MSLNSMSPLSPYVCYFSVFPFGWACYVFFVSGIMCLKLRVELLLFVFMNSLVNYSSSSKGILHQFFSSFYLRIRVEISDFQSLRPFIADSFCLDL